MSPLFCRWSPLRTLILSLFLMILAPAIIHAAPKLIVSRDYQELNGIQKLQDCFKQTVATINKVLGPSTKESAPVIVTPDMHRSSSTAGLAGPCRVTIIPGNEDLPVSHYLLTRAIINSRFRLPTPRNPSEEALRNWLAAAICYLSDNPVDERQSSDRFRFSRRSSLLGSVPSLYRIISIRITPQQPLAYQIYQDLAAASLLTLTRTSRPLRQVIDHMFQLAAENRFAQAELESFLFRDVSAPEEVQRRWQTIFEAVVWPPYSVWPAWYSRNRLVSCLVQPVRGQPLGWYFNTNEKLTERMMLQNQLARLQKDMLHIHPLYRDAAIKLIQLLYAETKKSPARRQRRQFVRVWQTAVRRHQAIRHTLRTYEVEHCPVFLSAAAFFTEATPVPSAYCVTRLCDQAISAILSDLSIAQ